MLFRILTLAMFPVAVLGQQPTRISGVQVRLSEGDRPGATLAHPEQLRVFARGATHASANQIRWPASGCGSIHRTYLQIVEITDLNSGAVLRWPDAERQTLAAFSYDPDGRAGQTVFRWECK